MGSRRTAVAVGTAVIGCISAVACLPLLAASSAPDIPVCNTTVGAADGTPSIASQSLLTATDLTRWWISTGRSQPQRLAIAVADLAATYLTEATAEGIRGDLAFAQAVLETGHFTSSDTAINNLAGIGHYDGASRGSAFPDPLIGVRAHIQLLKKYLAGNDAPLAHPDVAPDASARATTWGGLAGTWATSPDYWTAIEDVYRWILSGAGIALGGSADATHLAGCPSSNLTGYALPVDRYWYEQHPDWFSRPHHDYPAIDIPVPTGTPSTPSPTAQSLRHRLAGDVASESS